METFFPRKEEGVWGRSREELHGAKVDSGSTARPEGRWRSLELLCPPPGNLRLGVKFIARGHRDSVLSAASC